ncbi:MAG: glycosyltransferase family 2 protein [Janthinobacterium lividum]
MPDLAIVIPAYKDKYLKKTLTCFANQTLKDFNIYIGDDCSPFNIKEICNEFADKLNISYTKFNNNIGAKNLVHQWSRCINLTLNEKWIWLFSDDDLVDTNCVENFIKNISNIENDKLDIYRFNTIVIDQNDIIIRTPPIGPEFESSEEMAYNLLLDKRSNSLADHIFSRKIYEKSGGLIFTEYAQGADWIMSILFSKETGIRLINNSNFYWRYSGSNISSSVGKTKIQMLDGHVQFIKWVVNHFIYLKEIQSSIKYIDIIKATRFNFENVLIHHFKGLYISKIPQIVTILKHDLRMSPMEIMKFLFNVFNTTNKYLFFLRKTKSSIYKRFAFH